MAEPMEREGVYQKLLGFLGTAIAAFPDQRQGKNRHYSMADIARGAFGVFFCQSPSFLAHQQLMEQAQGRNNGRTLFGVYCQCMTQAVGKYAKPHIDGYCISTPATERFDEWMAELSANEVPARSIYLARQSVNTPLDCLIELRRLP